MKKVIKLGRHNLDWKPIIIAFSNASNLSQISFRIMNAKLTMLVTKSTTCSYLIATCLGIKCFPSLSYTSS